MVTPELDQQIQKLLGSDSRKILVTGATGFVGRQVAVALSNAGQKVTATGRNHYLAPPGIQFSRADIRDKNQVDDLCKDQDVVIHCASNTSPWGPYAQLAATNVDGTKNVVEGCRRNGVSRLVHVSSTSIQFDFRDQLDISEDDELPDSFACSYARTKHVAETVIREACDQGLNAVIVRARAVFGPGDQSLLPRLLEVYDSGRLKQIGNGKNVTDLTYVDNLVYALVLAMDNGESGATCTATGGKSIAIWELVRRILRETGRSDKLKRIPYPVASFFARASETTHRLFKRQGEPLLTRYSVGLLAKSQSFNTDAAKRQLGYSPIVSMDAGIQRTIEAINRKVEDHSPVRVNLSLFTTGFTRKSLHFAERGAKRTPVEFHASFALIEHPVRGLILFDTGYSPRIHEATQHWPYKAYAKATPVETSVATTCSRMVQEIGVDPSEIGTIVVSHMHADHICGLRDFPNAEFVMTSTAWQAVKGRTGLSAVKRAYLPSLVPENFEDRLFLLPKFRDAGIGPFDCSHDLFGDGSVRLIELPGHADGQIGALIQTGDHERTFLIADAVWTRNSITKKLTPTFAFRMIADDPRAATKTWQKLCDMHEQFPDTELVPCHCPSIAQQYQFHERFEELRRKES